MSSSEPRAVFISYSSEDVEAAQRIANALREAGIEVWFDRSELRGGDAWDQNIRRQIKECALFLPIISQTTERRPEGYFRLEWRLADNRTHHMGRTKAFLIPVCIDPTVNQGVADVPDSFLAVHWTLLPDGEANQGFVDNVKTLLSGPTAADAGRTRPSFSFGSHPPTGAEPAAPSASGRPWLKRLLIGGAVAAVLAAVGFVSFFNRAIEDAQDKIAVLPFEDLSDTPNAAIAFADGLQGDIIKKLDELTDYTATPRPEVARYRDNPKPIREVARELGVLYIVTGSATRVGETIRMDVSLLSVWENATLWSKTYPPFDVKDRFTAQTAAANAIAEDLKTALAERARSQQAGKQPAGTINAVTLYRDVTTAFGRDRITSAWLKKQEQLLQAAVDADENFAAGWALLGTIHSLFIAQGYDTSEERYVRAQNAIEAATSLDPDSADTLRAEGIFLTEAMRDYTAAIEKFKAWQQKESNAADPFGYLGAVYRHQGKWVEALGSLREATTRDPGNLTHFRTLEQLAIEGRNYDQAGQTRTTILNLLTPGALARAGGLAGRGGVRGGSGRFDPAADIPLLADLPEESYRMALIQLHGWGQTAPGDKLFASLTPEQAALPRFVALKTDWLRRTGRLDEAIRLDQQQPHFADDDDPSWRQALDIAAAFAAKDDMAAARTRLNGVTGQLQSRLISEPDNRRVSGWLGLAHALLGEKDAALRAGQEAVRLATSEGDAPAIATARLRLVLIQSWVGELDAAFAGLAPLLTQTGLETTIPAMKLDPWFAKLRADPRFAALTSDPQNTRVLLGDQGGRGGRGSPGDQTGRAGFAPRGGETQQNFDPTNGGRRGGNGGGRGQLPVSAPAN